MITDLKDLQKLLKLCRAQGITEFKMNDIEIKFGELPNKKDISDQIQGEQEMDLADPYANFPSEIMTPEQLAHYAHGGLPDNDPFNKEAI